jgi:hypothetical protein
LRRSTTLSITGAILAMGVGAACEPTPPPVPANPQVVVEGPVYSFDTVVVRGSGCDPAQPAGARLLLQQAGSPSSVELRAMGSAAAAVQPDGSVAATFQTPLLVPGGYVATLLCTGSITNVATTLVSVLGAAAPQATVSVTSPIRSGGSGVLTGGQCGRSANGEVQASVRIAGPASSFSFYGATRSDGTVVQGFTVPAGTPPGSYSVQLTCGRNPSQSATGQLQVI